MFFVAPVAPSGSGNYPQNPTNLRVELRKLKFVAKNDWHNVSRVKRQGGKSNAGSKKEAALANSCWAQGQLWLGQRPHCPGPAVLHQGLCNKSSTAELFRTKSHDILSEAEQACGEYRQIRTLRIWNLRH